MDEVRAFHDAFREAWPDDLDPVQERHLSLRGEGMGDVVYRGPLLRAPFHRGMAIHAYYGGVNAQRGASAALSLSVLVRGQRELLRNMAEIAGRVDKECNAAGARLLSYQPTQYSGDTPVRVMTIRCKVELIDDALNRRAALFDADSTGDSGKWHALRRELRAQDARRRRSGRSLEVDKVLGWHLAAMTGTQLARLSDLLAENPVPTGEDGGRALAPEWDRTRLERHGIALPEGVSSLRVLSGRIVGKVRLGPALTWNKGRMTTTARIPETVVSALAGRPLSALAEHPSLPDVGIQRAAVHRNGLRTVWVDVDGMMTPFPSGLEGLR